MCLLHCSIDGEVVGLQVPMMAARFTGTGDLFTSLYLAWSEHGVKVSTLHTYCMCRHGAKYVYLKILK